ncbi:hypothetical protein [Rickettsia parkeri]|uniref:hypothetical protein n=1 Tax=Rickettsia parkeri TaxID=35792 RepID=UPI0021BE8D9B|nr:hypothetical protein [Rickettsia parkeri]
MYSAIVKDFDIKNNYLRTIEEIKNSKLASEFANFSYEELKNHELFKEYEISEYNALINKNSKVAILFEYKPSSNSSNPITKIINKFIAKENIFRLAVVEKNIALMEEVTKDILKSAPIVLNLLKTQGEWYQKYLNFIAEIYFNLILLNN